MLPRWSQHDFKISKKHYRAMTWALRYQPCVLIFLSGLPWAGSVQLCIPISMSGLHWAGSVQRGGFLFKELWTRIVFWPDTCLMCRGLVLCAGVKVLCAGVQDLCAGVQVLCAGVKVLCAGIQVLCSGSKV